MINLESTIEHAEECLIDTKENFRIERYKVCVSRSYYCIFHCMQALLYSQEIFVKTHSGTINKFGEKFIKTGLFESRFSTFVTEAFNDRLNADYDFQTSFSEDKVKAMIAHAENSWIRLKVFKTKQAVVSDRSGNFKH